MSGRKSCRVYVGNLAWRVKWPDLKDHMKAVGEVVRADVFEDRHGRSQGCGIVEFATPEEAAVAIEKLNNTELFGRQMFVREDREDDSEEPRRPFSGGAGGGQRGGGRGGFGGGRGGFGGGRGGGPYGGGGGGFGGFEGGGGGYGGYGQPGAQFGGYSGYGGGAGGFRGGGMLTPANALRDHVKGRQVFVGNLNFQTTWQDLKDLFREVADVQRADVFQDPFGASKGCGTVIFESAEDAEKAVEKFNNFNMNGRTLVVRIDQGPTRGGSRRQG